MYFARWHTQYREALATHRQNVLEARGQTSDDDDDDAPGKKGQEKKKSPKVVKAKKRKDDDDEKDPDYVAMQDLKS